MATRVHLHKKYKFIYKQKNKKKEEKKKTGRQGVAGPPPANGWHMTKSVKIFNGI